MSLIGGVASLTCFICVAHVVRLKMAGPIVARVDARASQSCSPAILSRIPSIPTSRILLSGWSHHPILDHMIKKFGKRA